MTAEPASASPRKRELEREREKREREREDETRETHSVRQRLVSEQARSACTQHHAAGGNRSPDAPIGNAKSTRRLLRRTRLTLPAARRLFRSVLLFFSSLGVVVVVVVGENEGKGAHCSSRGVLQTPRRTSGVPPLYPTRPCRGVARVSVRWLALPHTRGCQLLGGGVERRLGLYVCI